ncbi:hypothetical protein BXZ70DRAFT_915067 [Cristinia sonorae]|uniref:Vacuolar import and degradation protein 21 n=1 Tax=Cristinia sonorae TaxID=1940300 RepID=A0A8K0UXV6_9AGAR|nr:hypothetical protein BXZ70DRAFT_915067 [Cristinia sonorae]
MDAIAKGKGKQTESDVEEEVAKRREEYVTERLAQLREIQGIRVPLMEEIYDLLQQKQTPGKLFKRIDNKHQRTLFMTDASNELLKNLRELGINMENMQDVVAVVESSIPPPPSPLMLQRGFANLASLPIVDSVEEDGAEQGPPAPEERQDEVMDVDQERQPLPSVEVVDLTQDEEEEEGELDEDVVLVDVSTAAASAAARGSLEPGELPSQDLLLRTPAQPSVPLPEPEPPAEAQPAATDVQQEDSSPMEGVEQEASDIASAKPLVPNPSEEVVSGLLSSATTSEPPLPMSRTTSGQYSLSALPPSMFYSPSYTFTPDTTPDAQPIQESKPLHDALPVTTAINSQYTLPPLNILPVEFQRKAKVSSRQSRRREKEKEKEKGDGKQEWAPMGINKWGATVRANPVYKKINRATKCLSTRDWNIAINEVKLLRTLERVEQLKELGHWSFRQPKKQRGVGGLMKTHRDYLMDEMKWMRTDFREERRWKLALAYNLAHAVIEWHEAGTYDERVRRGICVMWKRPKDETAVEKDDAREREQLPEVEREVVSMGGEEDDGDDSKQNSTPGDGYGSDDDSDDEQEKEQQDVLDVLDPASILQDELERTQEMQEGSSQDIRPKLEDVEDLSALRPAGDDKSMDVDSEVTNARPSASQSQESQSQDAPRMTTGLKDSSANPVLGSGTLPAAPKTPSKKTKSSTYAPLREQIVYSEPTNLFIDLDDLELLKGMSELTTDDHFSPPPDLTSIFPDLQPYSMLDLAPPPGEGKRRSDRRADKDDPNKRAEDTTYTKLVPTSEVMWYKPTLLGPLDPAHHWTGDGWTGLEETAVVADFDSPSARPIDEAVNTSGLYHANSGSQVLTGNTGVFGGTPATRPPSLVVRNRVPYGFASLSDVKINPSTGMPIRQRPVELQWTPQDDALLKQMATKYPGNWLLIAEAFNSCRVTISTEKRTALDCFTRFSRNPNAAAVEDALSSTPQPTTPMTTRGIKRSFTSAISSSSANYNTPSGSQALEPKKRRHTAMHETLRKAAKKREAAQKAQLAAQRKPAQMHDTHAQYSKMPKYTPAELVRMKTEADARLLHESMLKTRREEEANRQRLLAQQQLRMGGNSATAATAPRPSPNGIPAAQGVPQIRTQQVNISQQQRLSSLGVPNARSVQQILQAQQHAQIFPRVGQAQGQVTAQGQVQAQVQQASMPNSLAANVAPALSSAHLSTPFVARTTSTSPGLPQQSPPLLAAAAASNAGSPRPASAQAQAQAMLTSTQQANARSATVAALGHYYPPSANLHPQQQMMTSDQVEHANRLRMLIQQQSALAAQQQQQAHNTNQYPQS